MTSWIQGVRLINALVRGMLTPEQLETLLADVSRKESFCAVLVRHGEQVRLAASPEARQTLALSRTAYPLLPEEVRWSILNDVEAVRNLAATIINKNPEEFTFEDIADVVDDEAAMRIIFASEPACEAVLGSRDTLDAIINSGPGMAELCKNPSAVTILAGKQGQPGLEDIAAILSSTDNARAALAQITDEYTRARLYDLAVQSGDYSAFRFFAEQLAMPESAEFTTAGTHIFTVPSWVTHVHVLCVGNGGYGGDGVKDYGGGGGGLAWGNNRSVLPGQTLEVVVGNSSDKTAEADTIWTQFLDVKAGNGAGGDAANSPGRGGSFTGDGGGRGGNGGSDYGGGGGAGGYTGTGGKGGRGSTGNGYAGSNGYGGAGGGGTGVSYSSQGSGGGGGVGLYGAGDSGSGGTTDINAITYSQNRCGKGGSGGSNGSVGSRHVDGGYGGRYGGGGGGGAHIPAPGSVGAVRIIWGAARAFPSTNVEKLG